MDNGKSPPRGLSAAPAAARGSAVSATSAGEPEIAQPRPPGPNPRNGGPHERAGEGATGAGTAGSAQGDLPQGRMRRSTLVNAARAREMARALQASLPAPSEAQLQAARRGSVQRHTAPKSPSNGNKDGKGKGKEKAGPENPNAGGILSPRPPGVVEAQGADPLSSNPFSPRVGEVYPDQKTGEGKGTILPDGQHAESMGVTTRAVEEMSVQEAMQFLQRGGFLDKFSAKGKPRSRFFHLEGDKVFWGSSIFGRIKAVKLVEIEAILPGKVTPIMCKTDPFRVHEDLTFSVFAKGTSLDLQASSRELRNKWISALVAAVNHHLTLDQRRRRVFGRMSSPTSADLDQMKKAGYKLGDPAPAATAAATSAAAIARKDDDQQRNSPLKGLRGPTAVAAVSLNASLTVPGPCQRSQSGEFELSVTEFSVMDEFMADEEDELTQRAVANMEQKKLAVRKEGVESGNGARGDGEAERPRAEAV